MAIEKKLIHFNKNEDFKNRLENNEILDSSIVFIKDTNKIYTHGTEYQWVGWSELLSVVPDGYETFSISDGTFSASDGDFFVKL